MKGAIKTEGESIYVQKAKEYFKKALNSKNKTQAIVILGLSGIFLISFPKILKSEKPAKAVCACAHTDLEAKREKLEKNLENIISNIRGAGKCKVLITFESDAETIYATEERKNKEASEDKSGGEITRKKESDDCEKKYITIKDSSGTEHALAVTHIEPKVKGVIVICPGGESAVVKKRISEAVTTALSIPSKKVCITKSG